MSNRRQLQKLFLKHGFTDFKWIESKNIVISQWVRMKCLFGCKEYGKNASCPPNMPLVQECRDLFSEYSQAVVFHFAKKLKKPEQQHDWTKATNLKLLDLEREVFLSGKPKAFLLFMASCNLCTDCEEQRSECKNKRLARPTPEAMAIDVFSTVKALEYPIEILQDYSKTINRYAFLLVE